ncbi:DUF1217 domain-containing protein [Aliiruegeria sabulilitoris]|uniref:DUF1217 domain-containing protein n=1 Tax=Aliiruegeria sabulilitoris TaxID=1510458 RepID=UPI00082C520A|nr:DUF1217 domain-containing protein [Aliiruegeria sabulilitoris]NDR57883.1 DUF1217 domain-containing protein [Pseudoruegeria sp. M32A2M]
MTFQPIVPISGYAGWIFLNRTLEAQQETHSESLQTNTDYFAEHIGEVKTAEDLVSDRKLLTVALGAFGLDDDINSTFLIRKVLEEGVSNSDSLANKLSNQAYYNLSEAFGFGEEQPARTSLSGFADEIISAYNTVQFALDVGDQNEDFGLALNAKSTLPDIAESSVSNNAKWYSIMGSTTLRTVFETAFGLPSEFASLDIDEQLEIFKDKAEKRFGSDEVSQFSDPEKMDALVKTYLLRSEMSDIMQSVSASNTALMLLSGATS